MSRRFLLFILSLYLAMAVSSAIAQSNKAWYRYDDLKKDLSGYKDSTGKIKIRARFSGLGRARVFRNIIAVSESPSNTYYLLKNGKKLAPDSLYVWDMTFDCEQEGKIRFRDPVTDKVGFLDSRGNVVIPANYNDARPFYNGLALVIHHAKRLCLDGKPYDIEKCEHWMWEGTTALIDTTGRIVADHLDDDQTRNLDWYSAQLNKAPAEGDGYRSFKTVDGRYYTFLNYESEFHQWFYKSFLPAAIAGNFALYDQVRLESRSKRRKERCYKKPVFIRKYSGRMKLKLKAIQNRTIETVIFPSKLNPFIHTTKDFAAYYTDCNEHNEAKYPVFEVITTRQLKGGNPMQERYEFLRTVMGYQLISVTFE